MPGDAYARFVYRIWDAVERRTGQPPMYVDALHAACYCPACGDGTMLIRWLEHPEPAMAVSSTNRGLGCCSSGCTEDQIAEALT